MGKLHVRHVETRVTSLFAVEDEQGNLVQSVVLAPDNENPNEPLVLRELSPEAFELVLQTIRGAQLQAQTRLEGVFPP